MAGLRICTCSKDKYLVTLLILITLLIVQYSTNVIFYTNHTLSSIIKMDNWFQTVTEDAEILLIRKLMANNSYRESLQSLNKSVIFDNETMFVVDSNSSIYGNSSAISLCPAIPPKLVGPLAIKTDVPSWEQLNESLPSVQMGGRWQPSDCLSRHRVAIIIPYRDRIDHLKIFLLHIHPFLQRQLLDYAIYIIELEMPTRFNRAMLMNIGFVEALKIYDYQCFVFHDVDLLPEDDRNIYSCPTSPRHMSGFVDVFNYTLLYNDLFGGVSALTKEQFKKVNGFSNVFFGWGGEDDDMHNRVVEKGGYKIIRYSQEFSHYKMLSHAKDKPSPERMRFLKNGKKRWDSDGLNSLKYTVINQEYRQFYTWILVRIDEKEIRKHK